VSYEEQDGQRGRRRGVAGGGDRAGKSSTFQHVSCGSAAPANYPKYQCCSHNRQPSPPGPGCCHIARRKTATRGDGEQSKFGGSLFQTKLPLQQRRGPSL